MNESLKLVQEYQQFLFGGKTDAPCLRNIRLSHEDLRGFSFAGADLRGAKFIGADLSGVNFNGANLQFVDFRNAKLRSASIHSSNLIGAYLAGADLTEVEANEFTSGFFPVFPEEGSFVAWKSVRDKLVKLLVPEDAARSNATSRKGRVSKALVLDISGDVKSYSHRAHDQVTLYKVGEMVYPDSWDENRWNECSHGIHCFLTKQEAIFWSCGAIPNQP